jgi:hypothetical protein
MIATGRSVFLHLHKSAGTFVNECLVRFLPGARRIGYHLPRHLIPPDLAGLPVLGIVRNPWSYYVSWYSFQSARRDPNVLYRMVSEDGRLDFAGTVRNLVELGMNLRSLDRVIDALPRSYGRRGINLPGFALAPLRGRELGFYSYLYEHMFGSTDGQLTIGRMESLRTQLPLMLESTGEPVSREMRRFIDAAAPRNAAAHGRYTEYYDDELRDLVSTRDAAVILRHGYRFGD